MQKAKLPYNTEQTGITTGLLIPLMVIIGFYIYRGSENIGVFFEKILNVGIFSELISLCVVPNLLLFFIFIWTNRLKSARGVISATFIYALIVIVLKFFL